MPNEKNALSHSIHYYNTITKEKSLLSAQNDELSIMSSIFSLSPDGTKIASLVENKHNSNHYNIQFFELRKNKFKESFWEVTSKIVLYDTFIIRKIKIVNDKTLFIHHNNTVCIYKKIDKEWKKYWEFQGSTSLNESSISNDGRYIFIPTQNRQLIFKLNE